MGNDEGRHAKEVGTEVEGTHTIRRLPGSEVTRHHPDDPRQQHEGRHSHGAQKTPPQVVPAVEGLGEEQRVAPLLEIPQRGTRHHGAEDEQPEQAEHRHQPQKDDGSVSKHRSRRLSEGRTDIGGRQPHSKGEEHQH